MIKFLENSKQTIKTKKKFYCQFLCGRFPEELLKQFHSATLLENSHTFCIPISHSQRSLQRISKENAKRTVGENSRGIPDKVFLDIFTQNLKRQKNLQRPNFFALSWNYCSNSFGKPQTIQQFYYKLFQQLTKIILKKLSRKTLKELSTKIPSVHFFRISNYISRDFFLMNGPNFQKQSWQSFLTNFHTKLKRKSDRNWQKKIANVTT